MPTLFLPLLLAALPQAGDLPSLAPAASAPAHVAHQWQSAGGLRFIWWLPEGYDGKEPRNLTIILHGTGLDHRWGHANHPPKTFRPQDVVVSVDGTSPGEGSSRLFLGEKRDADAFRDFLEEMKNFFRVRDVFLYGHSQGGFFVTFYSGLHPETVAGVVAHASGAWNGIEMGKKAQAVAVAFMHGTADPVVPYGNSSGSWAAFRDAGFDALLLRRMPGYNHWPNAVRATECLDWCEAMTTQDPDRALALAKELLRAKGPDEYQYEVPPAYAAARMVLRRFSGDGFRPFGNLHGTLQGHADEVVAALDKQASEVAEGLQRELGKKLTLDKAPIAALLAFRADFRGVESAERWLGKLGFDKAALAHEKAAGAIYEAWYAEKMSDGERFTKICGALAEAWLADGLPPDLGAKLEEWHGQARSLDLDKKALKSYEETVPDWRAGWDARVWENYARLAGEMKVPN